MFTVQAHFHLSQSSSPWLCDSAVLVEPVLDCAVGAEYFATAAAKLLPQEEGELSLAGLALLAAILCLRQFPVERGVSRGF